MKKHGKHILILLGALLSLSGSLGCSGPLTTREKGAAIGAVTGAGVGAIIGSATGHAGAGAAIGSVVGLGAGVLVGDQLQKQEQKTEEQRQQIEQQKKEIARNRQILEELKKYDLEARVTDRGVVINLQDVLFEFDRAELTLGAKTKIRDIAKVLNNEGQGKPVAVEGHTDSVGNEDYNQRLSKRRAESVANALRDAGVSERLIRTRGFGELYPVGLNYHSDGSDNPAGRAKNRRVEIVIENEGSRKVVGTFP